MGFTAHTNPTIVGLFIPSEHRRRCQKHKICHFLCAEQIFPRKVLTKVLRAAYFAVGLDHLIMDYYMKNLLSALSFFICGIIQSIAYFCMGLGGIGFS